MRKLNVKLLVGLIVGTGVTLIGVYFLHKYQVRRNASTLFTRGEAAEKEGDYDEAMKLYLRYVRHKKEDGRGWEALASAATKAADAPDATFRTKLNAYHWLETSVQEIPDNNEVRRQLVDFQMSIGRFGDALSSLEGLIQKRAAEGDAKSEQGQKELTELKVLQAKCLLFSEKKEQALALLSELLGYDLQEGKFLDTPGPARNQVDPYVLLSMALRDSRETEAQSPAVLDRMVEENKQNPKAFLNRGQYFRQDKQLDKAEADFAEAAKLAPNDLDVILSQVDAALAKKNYEQADKILAQARKEYPKDGRVYRASIMTAMAQGQVDEGLALSEEGIKQVADNTELLLYRAELLLQHRKLEDARSVIRTLRDQGAASQVMLNYLDANLKLVEGDYQGAADGFEGVLKQFSGRPEMAEHVDIFLGQAYENLKKYDKALEAYDRVLAANPQSVGGRLGRARIEWARGGNRGQINTELQGLMAAEATADGEKPELSEAARARILGSQLQLLLEQQLQLPEAERNWKPVDDVLAQLLPLLKETQQGVLKAEVLLNKGQLAQARKILDEQRQKDPKDLATWLATANLEFKDKGIDAALGVFDKATEQLGDVPQLRLGRLTVINRAPAKTESEQNALASSLLKEEANLDKFKPEERKALLLAVATAYYRLTKFDDTARLWKQAIEADPDDFSIRLNLFELARDRGDEAGMNSALEELKKATGPNSDESLYADASKTLWTVKSKKLDPLTALKPVQEQLVTLKSRRENWDKLSRLAAEVELLLGSVDLAQENLAQAVRNNPNDQVALGQLFRLLVTQRKFQEARSHIAALGPGPHSPALSKLIAEVEEATEHPAEAKKAAQVAVPDDSQVYEDLAWRASMLHRLQDDIGAEKLFRRAVETSPEKLDPWLSFAEFYVLTKQRPKVDDLVQQASDKLKPDDYELYQAMAHEALGRNDQADRAYQEILAKRPDDIAVLRGAASFCVRAKRNDEAVKYLDKILATAAKDPEKHAEDLAWARRVKAQQVGAQGDYTQFLAALTSLDDSGKNGKLGPQEKVLKAMLLAQRPEPQSWMAGLKLFQEIAAERPLVPQEKWLVALLQQKSGNLPEARQLLLEALAQDETNADYLGSYVKILLDQDNANEAIKWVQKLQEAKPQDLKVYLLKAEVLTKQGKKAEALTMLRRMIPQKITQQNMHYLREIAGLCEAFEQYDEAEQLYQEYAQKDPQAGSLYLAGFLGRRGKVDESFALLQKVLRKNTVLPISELAIAILRANQAKVTPQQFALVDKWIKQGLTVVAGMSENGQPNPGEFVLKLRQAELRDLQGQYDEVMKLYEELLGRSDIDDRRKAIVLNNLSFLLAVKTNNGDRALKLVDDAIQILGPTSDLLDTRAMAHMARGDGKNAVEDLRLALNGSVEPMKLFHLALAENQAGNAQQAAEAWQRAKDNKFSPDQLSEPERKLYDQLRSKLGE